VLALPREPHTRVCVAKQCAPASSEAVEQADAADEVREGRAARPSQLIRWSADHCTKRR